MADEQQTLADSVPQWGSMSLDEIAKHLAGLPKQNRDDIVEAAYHATAERKWIPNTGAQLDAYFNKADVLLYGGAAGGGKLLDINELLPTPHGWVRMGDVAIGDILFDQAGSRCSVTAVSPVKSAKTYRLTFDDGTEVTCCADHLWLTYDAKELGQLLKKTDEWRSRRRAARPSRAKGIKSEKFRLSISARNSTLAKSTPAPTGSIRTTQQIVDTLIVKRGRRNHAVPVAGAIELPAADLSLDPYILGAWLGDGTAISGGFTGVDDFIWREIERAGFVVTHAAGKASAHHIRGLVPFLRRLGVLGNKHVPPAYLRGSMAQRLALLQGLMDTDGHAALDGGCEFDNTNLSLAEAVYELVASLGIKATINEGVATLYGRALGPRWRVKFTTDVPVFRLPRKRARQKAKVRQVARFRYIREAIEVDPVPMRCISVDSPTRLYLCTKSFIPTHNSQLILGLAFCEHKRSLIMRQEFSALTTLTQQAIKINGTKQGYNGSNPPSIKTSDGRFIQFSGEQIEKFQGADFDLKGFDEAVHLSEETIRLNLGWLRTAEIGQRTRAVLATNPPTDSRGDWIIPMFGPWLDINHPNPAQPGELRWVAVDPDGRDFWTEGPEPYLFPGERIPVIPKSRTFIPAKLSENPYYVQSGYQKELDALPEPYRSAYRDGNFMAARSDQDNQVIPTQWVLEAQKRWKKSGGAELMMSAMGIDVGQGGIDRIVIARRHGEWYAPLIVVSGKDAPDGSKQAALIVENRRDGCSVIVDVGGGYGGDCVGRLQDNKITPVRFNGSSGSTSRAKDGSGRLFENRRAEAWWRFREALNPDQAGGSIIALPDDSELRSELTAPTFKSEMLKIQIEDKKDIKKRLGHSPDKADAVVMAWAPGETAIRRQRYSGFGGPVEMPSRTNLGYSDMKKRI